MNVARCATLNQNMNPGAHMGVENLLTFSGNLQVPPWTPKAVPMFRAPEDHINIRILQTRISGIPQILMFMWSFGPLMLAPWTLKDPLGLSARQSWQSRTSESSGQEVGWLLSEGTSKSFQKLLIKE